MSELVWENMYMAGKARIMIEEARKRHADSDIIKARDALKHARVFADKAREHADTLEGFADDARDISNDLYHDIAIAEASYLTLKRSKEVSQ